MISSDGNLVATDWQDPRSNWHKAGAREVQEVLKAKAEGNTLRRQQGN